MTAVLEAVHEVLEEGRRAGVAPALSAVVLRGGATVHASVHGVSGPERRSLREDDLFDVASLTKVMATATLVARLVDDGTLALDAPIAPRLAGFAAGGKEAVTLRQLLAHASGLPRWRPYYQLAAADRAAGAAFRAPAERPAAGALAAAFERGRAVVRAAVLAEPLEAPPGTRAVYCDPGFLALGFLVEEVLGGGLAALAQARVFGPLGLADTFFLDGREPAQAAARAAGRTFVPTEECVHRREVNRGAVNDDNAWAMGGSAGHAGVFSTARDVAAFGQAWLDALRGRPGAGGLAPDTAAAFARRDGTPGTTRALGWDTPSEEGSSLGSRLGRKGRTIGHLGFTGTSLWIDAEREVVAVLLTNRVHPSRDNELIRAFRPRFHDVVAEAMGIR